MEEIEESFRAFDPTEAAKAVKSVAAAKAERAGIEKSGGCEGRQGHQFQENS